MAFIKLMQGPELMHLIKTNKNAFILLTIIAARASRDGSSHLGLEIGEALIGDYTNHQMTYQEYRNAKRVLIRLQYIGSRATTKGTIAKLTSKAIFDLNLQEVGNQMANERQPNGNQEANGGQTVGNQKADTQPLTKNEEVRIKNEDLRIKATTAREPEKIEPWLEASNLIGLSKDLHHEMKALCSRRPNIDPCLVAHKVQGKYRNLPYGDKYVMFQKWFISEFEPKQPDPEPEYKLGMKRKGHYYTPHDFYCKITDELLTPEHPNHPNNVNEGHPNYIKPRSTD